MYSISTESARYRLVSFSHSVPWQTTHTGINLPEDVPRPAGSGWVSGSDYRDLLHSIGSRSNDQMHAATLGLAYRPKYSGVVGYLAENQPTLRDLLTCFCRHSGFLMRGAHFELAECGQVATLSYTEGMSEEPLAFDVEMTLAALTRLLRDKTEGAVRIRQVSFGHRPRGSLAEMRRVLQTRIAVGQEVNSIIFDAAALDMAIVDADPDLRAGLQRLMALAGILPEDDTLLTRARAKIAESLGDREFGITALADSLCMTPRTLQRHLTTSGQTFSGLRDQVRKDQAMAMLGHTDLPIGEISYRLGFTEVSSFYRSFRQWTSLAPGAYRKQNKAAAVQGEMEVI